MKTRKIGWLRTVAALVTVCCVVVPLSACGSNPAVDPSKGRVYFLNSKSEVVNQLESLAREYTEKTGVEVVIRTAASGTNNESLVVELSKKSAPTMFNIAGYDQFARFKKYMMPVQNTKPYQLLTEEGKRNAFSEDGVTYTLPYAAEWYGIIYNKKIINEYISKDYAVIESLDELNSYKVLEEVTASIQDHKDDLGLKGAWASPGLDSSDDYRFVGHMIRVPMYYELRDRGVHFSTELDGRYISNYKNLWDLQVKNSPVEPKSALSGVTYEDSTGEFARGEVAFYTNGTWSYTTIAGNGVADEDIGFLPYYMGIKGEEGTGPFSIYDANWAVNKNASEKDKKATLDFIEWLVSSNRGRQAISQDMGLSAPYATFTQKYQPKNPLIEAALEYQNNNAAMPYSPTLPGTRWHDDMLSALVEYTQGTDKWDRVETVFTKKWSEEWENYKTETGIVPETGQFPS